MIWRWPLAENKQRGVLRRFAAAKRLFVSPVVHVTRYGQRGNPPTERNTRSQGYAPKSQDNCSQLSYQSARPDKIGTYPGRVLLCKNGKLVLYFYSREERLWESNRA